MSFFSRLIAGLLLGSAVLLPIAASNSGWGISGERNARIIKATGTNCPAYQRDSFGRCRRSHRSYYYGRSHIGGGPGYGK